MDVHCGAKEEMVREIPSRRGGQVALKMVRARARRDVRAGRVVAREKGEARATDSRTELRLESFRGRFQGPADHVKGVERRTVRNSRIVGLRRSPGDIAANANA